MNTCKATWRTMERVWGTATEYGYKPCGGAATHVRSVKAEHHDVSYTYHYCADHAPAGADLIEAEAPEGKMKRYNEDTAELTCTHRHFELYCEDCDARRMSRATPDNVQDWYETGRVTQDDYEAYMWLHSRLSPYRSAGPVPDFPAVRRIIGKLLDARPELPAVAELKLELAA